MWHLQRPFKFGKTCTAEMGFIIGDHFLVLFKYALSKDDRQKNYFEIPYYQTEFDLELRNYIGEIELHDIKIADVETSFILELIERYEEKNTRNFAWS